MSVPVTLPSSYNAYTRTADNSKTPHVSMGSRYIACLFCGKIKSLGNISTDRKIMRIAKLLSQGIPILQEVGCREAPSPFMMLLHKCGCDNALVLDRSRANNPRQVTT